jgi:hypothetical protein
MAPIKYLSEFCTYKALIPGSGRVIADPNTPLEQQIQAHILASNHSFFRGKYAQALNEYLSAWGLLPKFVLSKFPGIAVKVDDARLLEVNMLEHLMEASVQVLRLRDLAGPELPIIAPVDPPDGLIQIAEEYGGKIDVAQEHYRIGAAYTQMGEADLAQKYINRAFQTSDPELRADATAVSGAIELSRGNFKGARKELEAAVRSYKRINRADGMAAIQHNLGVTLTLDGDAEGAAKHFAAAAVHAPARLKWQVRYAFDPGIASVTRPMGQAGLPLLLKDSAGKWSEIPSVTAGQPKRYQNVVQDGAAIQIDLQKEGAAAIKHQLLESRINANTLIALETYLWDLPQFVSYLAHVQGFVLPLALGDTYFALGDYEKAATYYTKVRDYKYLNRSIERPMVWRKLARIYLQLGNRLYRNRDIEGAQTQYEHILRILDDGFDLSGPLYSGGFAPLEAETMDFLNASNRLAFTAMDYARRMIILEALANLTQILKGINYLGFPEDIIPIHSWHYLQNMARYFANHAIQAERAYISFKDSSEREEFTHLALEQAVDAQGAALKVAELRVTAADAQHRVAYLSADLAQGRLDNAIAQKTDYDTTSKKLAKLDEIIAWANAPRGDACVESYASVLGIEPGTYKEYTIVTLANRARGQISRKYELRNMQRKINELTAAKAVADAQVDVADKMVDVAAAQRDLAELRWQQAQAQLEFFKAQEFTPELWDNLAQAQREISRCYLDWAIGAAFLMEQAFEFEYDTEINRIRFDYERSELHGLLAADFLLADIDQFSYDRLLETEKQIPMKVTVALADRYPYQFYQQFQRTGRIDFETFLDDFDRWTPGSHLRKLRRVEVVVEGLVGPQGLHGTLTNSGVSYYRDRDGARAIRLQKPETMVLSRYDLRNDGFVFTTEEDVLAIFENSGVASGWILEFPPESNDIDYQAITNIHLVFYFDAYHGERVANMVRAEMAATAIYEYTLGLGLRFQYPDEFFGFQDTGEVTFDIDNAYLPYDHTNPRIRDVYLAIETEQGTSLAGLVVNVIATSSGININQTTDANGIISTDAAAVPLNALRDKLLMDTWTVRIDQSANAAAFDAGFNWEKVSNIFLFVEYTYTPRGCPAASDNFSVDSLAAFDVVDDPGATSSAPSNWTYDAANQLLRQTSNIYGVSGATSPSDPNKPGTYLIRKTAAEWPELRDLVLRCHLNSGDNDGIGVVFRYQDADNFYFFLMDAQRNYRRLGKKVGGTFQELEMPAVNKTVGYNLNQDYELTIAAVGDAFKVYLDGVEILSGRDRSMLQPGRVGFYAWGNTGARFLDLNVQPV